MRTSIVPCSTRSVLPASRPTSSPMSPVDVLKTTKWWPPSSQSARFPSTVRLFDGRPGVDHLVEELRVDRAVELRHEDPHAGVLRARHAVPGPVDEREAEAVVLLGGVRGVGPPERGRDEHARRLDPGPTFPDGKWVAEEERGRRRIRSSRKRLHALHGRAAQPEELQDGRARRRDGHDRADRHREDCEGQHERAPGRSSSLRPDVDQAPLYRLGDVGRVREGQGFSEQPERALELGHRVSLHPLAQAVEGP